MYGLKLIFLVRIENILKSNSSESDTEDDVQTELNITVPDNPDLHTRENEWFELTNTMRQFLLQKEMDCW